MCASKKLFALIFLLLWGVLPNCTVTNNEIIHKQLFDLNWKFSQNNYKTANEPGFIDLQWRSIDLPHDWSTDSLLSNFTKNTETETQSSETGWYKKKFDIPENWAGKQILIDFEGIGGHHEIFVNGISLKILQKQKAKTSADLTTCLNMEGDNLITIRVVVPREAGFEWKAGTGIFGHVWLVIKDNPEFNE